MTWLTVQERDCLMKSKDDMRRWVTWHFRRKCILNCQGKAWHLEGADVLSNLDIDCIEMTAYAIYRMRQARQSLDQDGLLIQQGEKLVKNPAANIEKDYQKIFWQGCVQLGLSPVSRAKLSK